MIFVADKFPKLATFNNRIAYEAFGTGMGFNVEKTDSLNDMTVLSFKEFSKKLVQSANKQHWNTGVCHFFNFWRYGKKVSLNDVLP